jgi:hypothetical protein
MKNQHPILTTPLAVFTALLLAATAGAQPGPGMMQGPQFGGAIEKLFGDHKGFSATIEFHNEAGPSGPMTVEGGMAFLNGMGRIELDMSKMQGASIPPQAMAQMQKMGMDKMVVVSIPDSKLVRMMYPGLSAYVEMPMPDAQAASKASDYKLDTTEIGPETVAGHPSVKNKVVMTGPDGTKTEATVWNATDMDKFPVKIEMDENGGKMTMTFKNVKLDKPDASLFNAPSDYKKYDNMMGLMMSRAAGAH